MCFDLPLYMCQRFIVQFSSVQSLSRVQLFATPQTATRQASLSITNSWSSLKLMSIKLVMPSNHLILCHPLLPPSIFPSIRVFSSESALRIRWPKYWSFSFTISPSNEHPGLISFRKDWLGLLAVQGSAGEAPRSTSVSSLVLSSLTQSPFCCGGGEALEACSQPLSGAQCRALSCSLRLSCDLWSPLL